MGSTGKILFGSFLAVCTVGMFLLFSMEKSARLTQDIEAMQLIATEKDNKISAISESLEAANATIEQVKAENAAIPELKATLQTTEKEKLVYVQQLDDFQAELQNQVDIAEQRFAEITALQQQQSLDNEKLQSLEAETNELAAALETTLADLGVQDQKVIELGDTLIQKERVIRIYKEKLDSASEEIALLQEADSNEQLNLALILDELAEKTVLAKELGSQLAKANNEAMAAGSETIDPALLEENKALIEKLTLDNDFLDTQLKELASIIKEL